MAETSVARLRSRLAVLSPRRHRWRRFLQSLPLDPDRIDVAYADAGPRDVIICGCPRTGTTLLAAALWQPPVMVTAMEPWDGMRVAPATLFRSLRAEVAETNELKRTRLDVATLMRTGKALWCTEGRPCPVAVSDSYTLGVKWPNYWRFLNALPNTRFIVTLRDPYETIASFKALGGRVRDGLQYDTMFNRAQNAALEAATKDRALRRVLLFDYVHSRILPHLARSNVHVVRYEDWQGDPGLVLERISGFLGVDVTRSSVVFKERSKVDVLDERDIDLISTHCETARALGYELDMRSS